MSEGNAKNARKVFVVHGRNLVARDAMFGFLRAIGLDPIEWSTAISATGSASPYIGQALDAAFKMAQAVVVLLTPDDIAYLRPEYADADDDGEREPTPQARPNVLFEAGMAIGRHPERTVLVELGSLRPFSDVAGRLAVRLDNSSQKRNDLANRLKDAGCDVTTSASDWLSTGDFSPPNAPDAPLGRRVPSVSGRPRNRLDAQYLPRASGSDRIQLINRSGEDVFDLQSPNARDFLGRLDGFPVARLPASKSVSLMALQASGSPDTFDLIVTGRTEDGEQFNETLFLDLNG
ncbi:nucleotide-binding protein [Mycobacteroides abscessus]|uniref:TIR domain-containing protein n=1 Tax=Mycobacteroides abscessus TaxID=36809 RepID=UPI001A95E4F5|nr:nucleotide-binding protein [Mycobacteroides abscessus]MDM2050245.1 nucleotide-binding protein [Mycobacteroides abscessus]MDM2055164.1 nucleotide-binding protein [Mycobacteroides abscessus]MDM2059859.1 nucleotide-binding protein [Mycobacteroides abscessus]MDM2064012.1 nucleotide-binding protein [Mycobacteroides abscessus]MDM2069022.1 nucleotide-binding protein [Mycobacteroides abscessus]